MSISSNLLRSVAVSLFALTAIPAVTGQALIPAAEAATNVSIKVFFDALAPHGRWVNYQNDYVFVPANVQRGWRPYTAGHWVYAEEVGWVWQSDEPFGWATYHYGRWGFADDIGWYWVPGTRWAPAWVSWKRSNDYVVWAPLPPSRNGETDTVKISVKSIPDNYWVAVPTRNFLDADLRVRIVDNDQERIRIVQRAEPRGTVEIRNKIVVNNVIDVKVIEKDTGKKVERKKIDRVNNPDEAGNRKGGDTIAVYEGEISRDREAKPKDVTTVEDVKKNRKSGGNADNANTTDQNATDTTTNQDQNNQDQTATGKKRKNANGQDNTGTATDTTTNGQDNGTVNQSQDNTATGDQTTNKKKRKNAAGQDNTGTSTDTTTNGQDNGTANQSQDNTATGDQTTNKKKRKNAAGQDNGTANQSQDNTTTDQSTTAPGNSGAAQDNAAQKKQQGQDKAKAAQDNAAQKKQQGQDKAKAAQDQQGQDNNAAQDQQDQQGQGKKNGAQKKKNQKCDPSQDANCAQ